MNSLYPLLFASGFSDDLNQNTNNGIDPSSVLGVKGKNKPDVKTIADSLIIPKTPEEFMASDSKIANALFGTGEIFKNKLNNLPKSKQAFDELVRRFPNSDYDVKAHYYQYLIFIDENLLGLAQKEKDYILQNYPQSEVADVLNHAGKQREIKVPEENAEKLYASTYQMFLDGNFEQVIQNRFIAKVKYPGSLEMPQFEFLEAVSYGKTKKFDEYKKALSDIITKYNSGEIKKKAQDYLIAYIQYESKLKDSTAQIPVFDTIPKVKDTVTEQFVVDTTGLWVLVQLKDQYMKVSDIISNLQAFNKKHFDDQKIKMNPVFLDGFAVIHIKKFDGFTSALLYFNALNIFSADIVGGDNIQKVAYYIIAPSNFKKIKNPGDLELYENFFNKNYFKK